MKGRYASFQRFGRVFGLPGSIASKYPRTADKISKESIYDATTDQYKYFDYYYALSEQEKKQLGKYDAHDNYGTLTKGISIWYSEDPRKKAKEIDQFDPINAFPRSWKNKDKKLIKDYTPIPQENIPLVVEGNHSETLKVMAEGGVTSVVTLKSSAGFQETHGNRPLIRKDENIALRGDKSICLPLKMPAETLHQILSCTKEIEVTCNVSINVKGIAKEALDIAKGELVVNCPNNKCPPACDTATYDVTFSCCTPSGGEVAGLSISSNRSKATLKRFKEYTKLCDPDKAPIELDLSKNMFQEQMTYALVKQASCEPEDYAYPNLPLSIKVLQKANPKTKLDAGCLTTPFTHGKYICHEFSEGDLLQTEENVQGCATKAVSSIIRIQNHENVPLALFDNGISVDVWDTTNGGFYQKSSPYAGGPSIAFRMHETTSDTVYSDPRVELKDLERKYYPVYVPSTCTHANGKTESGKKHNSEVFRATDPASRFLNTTAAGSCLGNFFYLSYCSGVTPQPCNSGELDGCTGIVSGRTCTCDAIPACDKLAYQETYGTPSQSARMPTDDIICRPGNLCCDQPAKLPEETASKFVSSLIFHGHLGRFVRVEPDPPDPKGGIGKSLPIPIPDNVDNKHEVEASLFYELYVLSETANFSGMHFYFTREAAEANKNEDNSFGSWHVQDCGKLTISHGDWEYKTNIYAPVFRQHGSIVTYGIKTDSYAGPGSCGELMACREVDQTFGYDCVSCEKNTICEQGSPSKGCGCGIKEAPSKRFDPIPYEKQLICRTGFHGGKIPPLCKDPSPCKGCVAYEEPDCTKPPCCSESNNPCDCVKAPECKVSSGDVLLTCADVSSFGALQTEYDINVSVSMTFKNFNEMEA